MPELPSDLTKVTQLFLETVDPKDELLTAKDDDGFTFIRNDMVDPLTDTIQILIADIIATLIDAGSEREAVMEDEELRLHIYNNIDDYSITPGE